VSDLTNLQIASLRRLRGGLGLTYAACGRRLGRSVNTVVQACLLHAIEPPAPRYTLPAVPSEPRSFLRNGKPVRRFTRPEDETIKALAAMGLKPGAIGRQLEPPRVANSVKLRLITLARRERRLAAAAALAASEVQPQQKARA
jgi:hypothetical protein